METEIKEECLKFPGFVESMRLVADVNNNDVDDRTVTSISAEEGTQEKSSPKSDRMSIKRGGDQAGSFGTDAKMRKSFWTMKDLI